MRRIISVLAVVVVMAALVAASAGSAFAYANLDNNGKAANAPGQTKALENCIDAITKQASDDNLSNGHKVPGNGAPTNCDHFYQ